MKIAVFLQNLSGGGAERMMVQLAGGIADRGADVDARADVWSLGEMAVRLFVVKYAQGDLLKIVLAARTPSRLSGRLHRGQE